MLILMGSIQLNPRDVDAFMAEVRTVVSRTREETGCLLYAVAVEDARAGRLLIMERWRDQESLTDHLARHQASAFFEKWKSRLKSDIRKFDAANERSLLD